MVNGDRWNAILASSGCLGSARVSRVGFGVSPKRPLKKSANPGRLRQHPRRARYPARIRVDPRDPPATPQPLKAVGPLVKKEMPDRASLAIRHLVDVSNQTKTELCVTVVSLSLDFFRCRGLNGMSHWMIN
jgi:hypothetical protein